MGSIVRFSEAASIAVHGTILIAKSENFLNVTKIADLLGGSRHHVAKIMQRLAKDGYIRSMRGPTGGFVMVKKPEKVTFLDLYESIEGKVNIGEEPLHHQEIISKEKSFHNTILPKMSKDFVEYMEKQYLSDYL